MLPVSDSPKPPAERITLTLPVINAAKNVAVVALGQVRACILQELCVAGAAVVHRRWVVLSVHLPTQPLLLNHAAPQSCWS